jgi:hypothetical protein
MAAVEAEGLTRDAWLQKAILDAVQVTESVYGDDNAYRDSKTYPLKCLYCKRRFKVPMHRARHVRWAHPEMLKENDDGAPEVTPETQVVQGSGVSPGPESDTSVPLPLPRQVESSPVEEAPAPAPLPPPTPTPVEIASQAVLEAVKVPKREFKLASGISPELAAIFEQDFLQADVPEV